MVEKNGSLDQSRRALLKMGAGGAVALFGQTLLPDIAFAQGSADPRVAKIVADTISVDMHNHVTQAAFAKTLADRKPDPVGIDLPGEMKKSGLSVLCFTYAVDSYRSAQPGDWYQYHLQCLAYTDRLLAQTGIRRAFTMADLKAAHNAKTPIVIQDSEGAQWIEGKIGRIEEAYRRGLRHLQLIHQMNDLVAPIGAAQQLVEPPGGQSKSSADITGLTAFGADVVRECNRLGIVVDMAHSTKETVFGALKVARQPLVVSHTGLDNELGRSAHNYVNDPGLAARLVDTDYAKAVSDAGGVMGIWHIYPTMKDYVTAMKQMVDVVGVDHVGIGTDTHIASEPLAPIPPPAASPAGGRGGRGAGGGTNTSWPDETTGFMYAVAGEMLAQGFKPDEISKVAGGNYCRVFDAVTKGHA